MGGIIGKLSFDRNVWISEATVQRMIDAIGHRGCATGGNSRASYIDQGIALGWCDPEPTSRAEVAHNETATIRAVADSDLSNASQLRQSLEQRGHFIARATDADLMAHAYEEWGDACVERFSGPFACAIWDEVNRRLLLARDRFGIRSLCFALLHGDGVVFGSEIRALLPEPSVGREWHPEAIDAYLALGYVPAPLTIYRRVSKLEPAHTLVVDGRRLTTRRYWHPPVCTSSRTPEHETIDLLESGLHKAVVALAADAGAGALTSDGVASAAITAMLPRGRTSLTVDTERELPLAAAARGELLTWLFDEPIADPGALTQYAAFAAARQHMTVALTGHGAAELWAGARARDLFDDESRHGVYTRRFSWQIRDSEPLTRRTELSDLTDRDLATADRAAHAAGLRLRHPYLECEPAELALRRRHDLDLPGARGMRALRAVAARHLPAAMLPPARPVARQPDWIDEAVGTLVPAVLLTDRFDTRGIFSRPALKMLWDEHQSGRRTHTHRLWSVLALELWFREFIDDDSAALPAEYAVLVRAA